MNGGGRIPMSFVVLSCFYLFFPRCLLSLLILSTVRFFYFVFVLFLRFNILSIVLLNLSGIIIIYLHFPFVRDLNITNTKRKNIFFHRFLFRVIFVLLKIASMLSVFLLAAVLFFFFPCCDDDEGGSSSPG
jgi:hypothetical protein